LKFAADAPLGEAKLVAVNATEPNMKARPTDTFQKRLLKVMLLLPPIKPRLPETRISPILSGLRFT
jgi:hypothetical protein